MLHFLLIQILIGHAFCFQARAYLQSLGLSYLCRLNSRPLVADTSLGSQMFIHFLVHFRSVLISMAMPQDEAILFVIFVREFAPRASQNFELRLLYDIFVPSFCFGPSYEAKANRVLMAYCQSPKSSCFDLTLTLSQLVSDSTFSSLNSRTKHQYRCSIL